MDGVFSVLNLIFLAIAVVIFLKLRGVLGQRTGTERPPKAPGTGAPGTGAPGTGAQGAGWPERARAPKTGAPAPAPGLRAVAGAAGDAASPQAGLAQIAQADQRFDPDRFVSGARQAYELVVSAFARLESEALRPLLAPDVYDSFDRVIQGRKARRETAQTQLVCIDGADIIKARMKAWQACITVRFAVQLVSWVRDAEGRIIEGDPTQVRKVTDVWTFDRDTRARDPNWCVVATST